MKLYKKICSPLQILVVLYKTLQSTAISQEIIKTGITYIYGQYEIGPYVCGIIKVTVP